MILKNETLILSFINYEYKNGGFCVVINPNNKVSFKEINLNQEEIKSLLDSRNLIYENKTPDYKKLINEYFDNLEIKFPF